MNARQRVVIPDGGFAALEALFGRIEPMQPKAPLAPNGIPIEGDLTEALTDP
jgi:hypothetical protein